MSQHYYSRHPESSSEERSFTIEVKGRSFSFVADHGVFSKEGLDFGSRFLIESFTDPDISGPLLDMGCGYGPIGIVLAAFSERRVVMSDVNERAVALARQNVTRNDANRVEVVSGDRFSGVGNEERFSAIVMNPPIRAGKATVHAIYSEAYDYLLPGGALWVVIRKKQGAPTTKRKLQELYREVVEVKKAKGYVVLKAQA
ncbi:class I SAM-dependent methyltransferase [Salicibibacter cibarius]|uniref:Class I SAM-dependent methyltransferase n=1 Tax=Salicibibacter cibarius TaxID=2743000 RepID=A0A7T6YZR9_9BACI|nr:class I SAM-dependent methyltransferase [Salicibibacter cibarius]QQK74326.1 class I SAM-dependent methyltransferase [Salicibibacter cibarius]